MSFGRMQVRRRTRYSSSMSTTQILDTSEIVAFVWGKRKLKTAKQLRDKLDTLGVDFRYICCDNWDSFLTAFDFNFKKVGKRHTVELEGNNNCFRQRLRQVFRKTCCFSKKLTNHLKLLIYCFTMSIMAGCSEHTFYITANYFIF